MTTDKIRKDKNQNIQVFIRLRPLNQREKDIKSLGVIEVVNNREVVVRQSQQTSHTKKFTFDRAFGPNANQLQVYQEVVSPLIEEVLNGYNCTVFAYGQTGTGKTHTMVGEHSGSETTWQNDPLAGIIPRALSQLFDELRLTNTEYTVRVSYLELYNEELFDLLSSSEDNSKLRIYEDVTRKGSNIVNGLEEITVYNKNEVYKIMAQGQERKRVASTLMNAQSSRSHTVFTIVVHMKENSPEGEELVKIGKLNLVDLAGSENISKAGSDNPAKKERARECVNINQSLLTLGRVITALVERHPHIPYRESKLTRILQESLGGRTKTSIIATISPGHKDLEETMSTLEYAHRAKNIQNKPEVNQKMTKKAILKEYAEEIDRLKRDLQAARDKNGVYLASETFAEMTLKDEQQRKEIQELLLKKRAMEEERDRMENVFQELNQQLESRNSELVTTVHQLQNTKAKLATTSQQLSVSREACSEQQQLVAAHRSTERALTAQARALLDTADVATAHVHRLHDTVDRRKSVESTNLEVTREFRAQSQQQRDNINSEMQTFADTLATAFNNLDTIIDTYSTSSTHTQQQNIQKLEQLVHGFVDTLNNMKSATTASHTHLVETTEVHRSAMYTSVQQHKGVLQSVLSQFLQSFNTSLQRARDVDVKGSVANFVHQWYCGAAERVTSLQRAHNCYGSRCVRARAERARLAHERAERRRTALANRATERQHRIADMEAETIRIKERLNRQLSDIEDERLQTQLRLKSWMEEERRLLEERLAKHVAMETQVLEDRLAKKIAEVEEEKLILEQRMEGYKKWQEEQLVADEKEIQLAEVELEESESGVQESEIEFKKYNKEFEEGCNAITVDMEVLSSNVVQVVEHVNDDMLRAIDDTQQHLQGEVSTLVKTDEESCAQFISAVDNVLKDIVNATQHILNTLVNNIETSNSTTTNELSSVAASLSELTSQCVAAASRHAAVTRDARHVTGDARAMFCDALLRHAELEDTYLSRQYKIYAPTGQTPSRTEYRYPRALAATSPHPHILARVRAARKQHEQDCIVIESDNEGRAASDSECSTSEDSAVFAAPSPPILNNKSRNNSIVKSTSETDIYALKRQQENAKENTDNHSHSISHKKPSKLPAPLSHKKPLVERNAN